MPARTLQGQLRRHVACLEEAEDSLLRWHNHQHAANVLFWALRGSSNAVHQAAIKLEGELSVTMRELCITSVSM